MWMSSAVVSSMPAIGTMPCLRQASKKAGQFFAVLWSVNASKFKPLSAAMPAMLLGVISLSPQGDRQEWMCRS